jgi:four helix bundle protein
MDLVEEVYRITRKLPDQERFGLMSQLQRSAISVPSNIAEGYGRTQPGEFLNHLSIARGSLMELQTQLILAGRLKYLTKAELRVSWQNSEAVGKMLTSLIRSRTLPKPQAPSPKPKSP